VRSNVRDHIRHIIVDAARRRLTADRVAFGRRNAAWHT
jgi:hypothetical protein